MNLSEIGKMIQEKRKERGYTQEALAKEAGMSRTTLSKLENGYFGNISVSTFDNILASLGYKIELVPRNPFSMG